ncbi:MAG: exosome complex exonuclease Rrp41 [Candidatus Heimdallarchaeota archaeon]|nr:exosome complex exonuclease Rrp41 [Candidatus Heimdallarchaeota archaeon]
MAEKKDDVVLITKDGIRHDGRKKDDLRNITFEVGVLDRADGSCLITWGKNKILAAVYGPRELHPKHMALPDRALVRCEYRMATFSVPDRKSPAPKRREREISKILGEALEPALFDYLYPRSVIDVFVEVLQADGGSRCAAVTAAALALADAGVPMRDLVSGCAAGNLEEKVVLDLDDVEDKTGQGDLPIAYLPNLDKIVLLQSDGEFTPEQYKEALDMLIPACKKVYQLQRDALTSKYSQITEEVGEDIEVDVEKLAEDAKEEDKTEKLKKETTEPKIEPTAEDKKKSKKTDTDKKEKSSVKEDKKKRDSKKPSKKNEDKASSNKDKKE